MSSDFQNDKIDRAFDQAKAEINMHIATGKIAAPIPKGMREMKERKIHVLNAMTMTDAEKEIVETMLDDWLRAERKEVDDAPAH